MILFFCVCALALPVIMAASCRLTHLHWRTHKIAYIAIYFGLAAGGIYAIKDAWLGAISPGEGFLLVAGAFHLWVSRVTWRDGPPRFVGR